MWRLQISQISGCHSTDFAGIGAAGFVLEVTEGLKRQQRAIVVISAD